MIYHDQVGFIPGVKGWFNTWKSINVLYHIYKIKGEKKPMSTSTDAGKALIKFSTLS